MAGEQERDRHSAAPDYLDTWYGGTGGDTAGKAAPDPYGQGAVSPYDLPEWADHGAPATSISTESPAPQYAGASTYGPGVPSPTILTGSASSPSGRKLDRTTFAVLAAVGLIVVVGVTVGLIFSGIGGDPTPTVDPTSQPTGGPGGGDVYGYGDDPELDALWDACEDGDSGACDDLYWASPIGSEYEEYGSTCGGRVDAGTSCNVAVDGAPDTRGDDPELDALWDACEAGEGTECDELYYQSERGSGYADFGATCGERQSDETHAGECGVTMGDAPNAYGDDSELDALWDACEAGEARACDDLFGDAPEGSEYKEFGYTCGDRFPEGSGEICRDVM